MKINKQTPRNRRNKQAGDSLVLSVCILAFFATIAVCLITLSVIGVWGDKARQTKETSEDVFSLVSNSIAQKFNDGDYVFKYEQNGSQDFDLIVPNNLPSKSTPETVSILDQTSTETNMLIIKHTSVSWYVKNERSEIEARVLNNKPLDIVIDTCYTKGDDLTNCPTLPDSTRWQQTRQLNNINIRNYTKNKDLITYNLSPASAFSNGIYASKDIIQEHSLFFHNIYSNVVFNGNLDFADPLKDTPNDISKFVSLSSDENTTCKLNGKDCLPIDNYSISAMVDSEVLDTECPNRSSLENWSSSAAKRTLTAGETDSGQNQLCVLNLNLDDVQNFAGTGNFNFYVMGDVNITKDFTMNSTDNINVNIFSLGTNTKVSQEANVIKLNNMFIYSPNATCSFSTNSGDGIDYKGAIACSTINLSGIENFTYKQYNTNDTGSRNQTIRVDEQYNNVLFYWSNATQTDPIS
jgi:hypothetical protein